MSSDVKTRQLEDHRKAEKLDKRQVRKQTLIFTLFSLSPTLPSTTCQDLHCPPFPPNATLRAQCKARHLEKQPGAFPKPLLTLRHPKKPTDKMLKMVGNKQMKTTTSIETNFQKLTAGEANYVLRSFQLPSMRMENTLCACCMVLTR